MIGPMVCTPGGNKRRALPVSIIARLRKGLNHGGLFLAVPHLELKADGVALLDVEVPELPLVAENTPAVVGADEAERLTTHEATPHAAHGAELIQHNAQLKLKAADRFSSIAAIFVFL